MDRINLPYRHSTLGYITDGRGNFLIINKKVYRENEWTFAGGGVDEGETAEMALKRELEEELLTLNFKIIKHSQYKLRYEWPDEVIEERFKNKRELFRGQIQDQFLVEITGDPYDFQPGDGINKIKWVSKDELPDYLIFPHQWEDTQKVLTEFGF